jgi:hypothetical protein
MIIKKALTTARNLLLLFNPLYAELYPICQLLALLGAHPILHVSRIRVNLQTYAKGRPNEGRPRPSYLNTKFLKATQYHYIYYYYYYYRHYLLYAGYLYIYS